MILVERDKDTRENLYSACMLMGMIKKRRKNCGCKRGRGYCWIEIVDVSEAQD